MAKYRAGEVVEFEERGRWHEGVLVYEPPEQQGACHVCADGVCMEWTNVLRLDGKWAYHVAECVMRPSSFSRIQGRSREGR